MQDFENNKGERRKPYWMMGETRIYIGADNGVTGSWGVVGEKGTISDFWKVPVLSVQDYTKAKKNITRIDVKELELKLMRYKEEAPCVVVLERPMKNPARFEASCSAMRALEASLTVIELLELPYMFIDSKEWQKEMLPKGIIGAPNLKKASLDIGKRLFPTIDVKHPDRDGILIAEYARRKRLL